MAEMYWTVFWRGAGFGILLVLLSQSIIIYNIFIFLINPKVRITPPSDGDGPDLEVAKEVFSEGEYSLPWPPVVVDRLKRMLAPREGDSTPTIIDKAAVTIMGASNRKSSPVPSTAEDPFRAMSPTIESEWVNLILNRMFIALRASKNFRKLYATKMSNKMNFKLRGSSFISQVNINDMVLGEMPPSIDGIRILKGHSDDLAVMVEADISYDGGASVSIQASLTNGSVIPVQVFMNSFSGTLRARLPSERWEDMVGYAFVRDPGVTFRVDSSITDNQMLRGMVNSVLSSLMRKTFLELWVLPSWQTTFLPLLDPDLEDWVAREDEDTRLEHEKRVILIGII